MFRGKPLPPGKWGLPIVGRVLQSLAYQKNPFQYLEDGVADYGPVFKTRVIRNKTAVITGPEACERFIDPTLVERAGAFPGFIEKLFGGQSLPFQDGVVHERTKQMVLEAFTADALDSYLPTMQSIVELHFKKWTGHGEFRWLDGLKEVTFHVIWRNLFGEIDAGKLAPIQQDYETISRGLVSLPWPLPCSKYGRALAARQRVFDELRRVVNQRKQSPTNDGLSRILRAAGKLDISIDQVVVEMHHAILAGFIVFGHLATAIVFATQESEVQERLRAEVENIDKPFTVAGLGQSHYLQQFVMEVKRLSPIIPALFGRAKQSFMLHGVVIPKGWLVIWALRNTNVYGPSFPRPKHFDPDRYAPFPQRERELHDRLKFVPQGGGPVKTGHACAGFDYSALLTSVFLAVLLRNHKWKLRDPSERHYDWTLNPPQPLDGLLATIS
jgi:cytochrome P450